MGLNAFSMVAIVALTCLPVLVLRYPVLREAFGPTGRCTSPPCDVANGFSPYLSSLLGWLMVGVFHHAGYERHEAGFGAQHLHR